MPFTHKDGQGKKHDTASPLLLKEYANKNWSRRW